MMTTLKCVKLLNRCTDFDENRYVGTGSHAFENGSTSAILNFVFHIIVTSYFTDGESRNFIGQDYCRSGPLRFVYLGISILCRIRGAPPRSGVLDFNFLQLKADIGHILLQVQ